MNGSGYERQHLSGEASFRSFVPAALQEVVRKEKEFLEEDHFRDRQEKIKTAAEHLRTQIVRVNQYWESLSETERSVISEKMLREEAEQSVLMAYPVRQEAASEGCGEEMVSWNPLLLNSVSLFEKKYTLEDVPDVFRSMADMDCEHLYYAAKEGLSLLERLPLSGRVLRDMHYIALYGPHYDQLYRGEFRNSPVWIGSAGGSLQTAEFVPPVQEDMIEAFSQLEKYMHYEEETDPLIKAALLHYQFETIHPFLDGNGRIGRLFTQLFLQEFCSLSIPWIPLSRVLIRGMDRYYKEIRLVQVTGDYSRWICWFTGILEDALKEIPEQVP